MREGQGRGEERDVKKSINSGHLGKSTWTKLSKTRVDN
jgi:hypothetical protein